MPISLYTDGAALGNPGKGGYAALLRYDGNTKEICGAFHLTTNNRMELMAVIVGLEVIKSPAQTIQVYSDSRYVVDAVNKKWLFGWLKRSFVGRKNADLWRRFLCVYNAHTVSFSWVPGHAGNAGNERCDFLATTAARSGPWLDDVGYTGV